MRFLEAPEPSPHRDFAEEMSGTSTRETRLALNESMFRSLNEKLAHRPDDSGREHVCEFICECSNADCFERVTMTTGAYERVRAEGTHFLLAYGHEDTDLEAVIETHNAYIVVAKYGPAGAIAEAEDPRA